MIRLGDGTADSHERAQAAVDDLWPFTGEMFTVDDGERSLIEQGIAVDPEPLRDGWRAAVARVAAQATLTLPADGWMQKGGRHGRHSEHLGHLLSELQFMQRSYPGASW